MKALSVAALAILLLASPTSAQEAPSESPDPLNKWIAAGALVGIYAGLTTWAYFAWYHNEEELPEFTVDGDGWFGQETYAGGADKLGHLWGNHIVARETAAILAAGGWDRLPASLIGSGLSLSFFTFIEIKDGYYYQFSSGDMVGNAVGAGLSVLLFNVPEIDEWIDFRVEYIPSREYLDNLTEKGDVNLVEDYSGQTYLLALHLAAIPALSEPTWLYGTKFFDLVGGFQAVNYKPDPVDPAASPRSQHLFLGVAVNMQHVLDRAFGTDPNLSGAAKLTHTIGHHIFEHVSVPFTTLRVLEAERSPDAP